MKCTLNMVATEPRLRPRIGGNPNGGSDGRGNGYITRVVPACCREPWCRDMIRGSIADLE